MDHVVVQVVQVAPGALPQTAETQALINPKDTKDPNPGVKESLDTFADSPYSFKNCVYSTGMALLLTGVTFLAGAAFNESVMLAVMGGGFGAGGAVVLLYHGAFLK